MTSRHLLPKVRTALFEIATREPEQPTRYALWTICVLLGVILLWAAIAHLDIVAVARGKLVPETYVKIVQPAESGIVREILVQEGDRVSQGQILIRLDATESTADSTAAERELAIQRLQARRVAAELEGVPLHREPADDSFLFDQVQLQARAHRREYLDSVAQESAAHDRAARELGAAVEIMRKLDETLPSYQRTADSYDKLAADKLVGSLQADEKRRDALEKAQDLEAQKQTVASLRAAVEQSERRLTQLKSTYENDLHSTRVAALEKATQLEQDGVKLKYRLQRLELRAPQEGIIKELGTSTVGAVVQPGTVLASLVPVREPLLAEVAVENQDIGFVHAGQRVRLKLATYPFQKYGMVEGLVRTVIADSNSTGASAGSATRDRRGSAQDDDTSLAPTFKALIELTTQSIRVESAQFPLAAGMQLTAEIVEGKRTILEYLLSPLQRVSSEAGMER